MTKLVYMDDFDVVSCEAEVVSLAEHDGKQVLVLDQTCFYAKGGGQDFDTGLIVSSNIKFRVEAVFFVDGEVKHLGEYENGSFAIGDKVSCQVDTERRQLNTRLHSAGHVIDMAVRRLGWDWAPGKGAHYPDMAFVEYGGEYNAEERESYITQLQQNVNEIIKTGTTNSIKFMSPEDMKAHGAVVPNNLPKGKPSRVMMYDDFAVPCGGTHVKNAQDINNVIITKIKNKGSAIRVSYSLKLA